MSDAVSNVLIRPIALVPLEEMEMAPFNPNKQGQTVFNALVESLDDVGMLRILILAPVSVMFEETATGGDKRFVGENPQCKYIIIAGNYTSLGLKHLAPKMEVPCMIIDDRSLDDVKDICVRLNVLHGEIDADKFTAMFTDLAKRRSASAIRTSMGFVSQNAFDRVYKGIRAGLPADLKDKFDEAAADVTDIAELANVLREVFKGGRDTWNAGYIFFQFQGLPILVIRLKDSQGWIIESLVDQIQGTDMDAGEIATAAFEKGWNAIMAEGGLEAALDES